MGAQGARRALPEDVRESLRAAFAADVAVRLPHLRLVVDVEVARRDAHTLASSAWVVGEPYIGALARAVEDQFEAGLEPTDLVELVAALEAFLL